MPVTETSVLTNLHDLFAIEDDRNLAERRDAERRAAADRERRAAEVAERRRQAVEAEAREREERVAAERAAREARGAEERAARELESRLETERLVALERVRAESARVADASDRRIRDALAADVARLRRTVGGLVATFLIAASASAYAFVTYDQRMHATVHADELALLRTRSELAAARTARDASRDENRRLLDRIARLEAIASRSPDPTEPTPGRPRPRPTRDPAPSTSPIAIRRCSGPLGCL